MGHIILLTLWWFNCSYGCLMLLKHSILSAEVQELIFCRWQLWEGNFRFTFFHWFINLSSSIFSFKVNSYLHKTFEWVMLDTHGHRRRHVDAAALDTVIHDMSAVRIQKHKWGDVSVILFIKWFFYQEI